MSLTTPDTIGRRIRFAQLRWKRLKASRERMQRAAEVALSLWDMLEHSDKQEGTRVMN